MLTIQEVERIVDEVLVSTLGPAGFERSDAKADVDSDGQPALFITVHFKSGAGAADGKTLLDAMTRLGSALEARGEHRFPYLRLDYPDDEIPYAPAEDFQQ